MRRQRECESQGGRRERENEKANEDGHMAGRKAKEKEERKEDEKVSGVSREVVCSCVGRCNRKRSS